MSGAWMDDSGGLEIVLRQFVQISVVAIAVYGIVRQFARHRPQLAHALWLMVLLKALTPPVVSLPLAPLGVLDGWITSYAFGAPHPSSFGSPLVSDRNARSAAGFKGISQGVQDVASHQAGTEKRQVAWRWKSAQSVSGSRQPTISWARWLFTGWGIVAVGTTFQTLVGFIRFDRATRQATVETPSFVLLLVSDLRQRLMITRQVRVRVVDALMGPAVVGWWRPTIILPLPLLSRQTATDLEPLLAHELIHIRRGDLTWSLVQAIATIVWWFHPLVRFAARSLTFQAERSCDAETLIGLGCSPARYARSLLFVLEQKHHYRTAPVFPGVRPIELTSERMERIMRHGQGSHVNVSRWVKGICVVLTIGILPGAAWVIEPEPTNQPLPVDAKMTVLAPKSALYDFGTGPVKVDGSVQVNAGSPAPILIKSYDVGELIKKLCDEQKLDRASVEAEISVPLPSFYPEQEKRSSADLPTIELDVPGHGRFKFGGAGPSTRIVGDTLYVFGDESLQQAFRESLDALQRYGLRQVTLSTRIIVIPAKQLASLDVGWRTIVESDESAITSSGNYPSMQTTTSPVQVTLAALIDSDDAQRLLDELQGDRRTNLLQAPRVTVFNGQSATINDGVQRPFVVAVDQASVPLIRVIGEGTEIRVRPELHGSEPNVKLSLQLKRSTITSVEEITYRHAGANVGEGTTLQSPQTQTQQLEVRELSMALDQTLLLGALPIELRPNEKGMMLLMVDVDAIDPESIRPPQSK